LCSARVVAIDLRPLWIVHIEREDRERERQRERESPIKSLVCRVLYH